ncbi:hypothetical protein ABPG75_013572 [Micractinium tetrahymenae]
MQLFGFNPTKCKTQCRLGVGRIKLLRNKKQLAMKGLRKEVAELMRQGKQGNARIRVEAVMREHRMLQAFEILELYLELLAVRAELLAKTKELPPDMVEAISSLIYAGERVSTDLAEVAAVGKLLVGKYSPVYKEAGFPHEVVSDLTCRKWQVNDDLVTCLAVTAPDAEEKLMFLEDIAKEFDVEFDRDAAALDMLPAVGRAPAAVHPPVETLAAAGAVVGSPSTAAAAQRVPPLAAGWHPPPVAPPPPATAAPQPGWHPPPAGDGGGASGGSSRLAKIYSGAFVVRRGAGGDPGYTDLPSASTQGPAAGGGGDGLGWHPPEPEDFNSKGRSFRKHVDAAAAWRHHRVHGAPASEASSSSGAAAAAAGGPVEDDFVTFPQRAQLPGEQQQQHPEGGQGQPLGHAGSAPSVNGPLAPTGSSWDRILPGVGTAPSSGGSTPSMSERHGSYADATQAAEAARRYSAMAVQAAQRAEEFAASQAGVGPSRLGPGGVTSNPGSGAGSPRGGGSPDGGGTGGPRFVQRSDSDIRRSYDAAPGPPTKPSASSAGPPSAPPAPAGSPPVAPPAEVPPPPGASAEPAAGADLDLPSVPTGGQGLPPPVVDELDELTRRFEALKRR